MFFSSTPSERVGVFRSCPLITPESARSAQANARHSPSYGRALRLDRPPSGALLGRAPKNCQRLSREAGSDVWVREEMSWSFGR